jgi:hypothetical protein
MHGLRNFQGTRYTLIVDALRYSLVLEYRAYAAISRALRAIERDRRLHPSEARALSAINNAWHIVDVVHRVRGLITSVPGLPNKTPEVQVFLRNTAPTEDFRNLYQHLNSEIGKIRTTTNPIMGVLSWVTQNPSKSITMFLGTGAADIQVHTVALDTWRGEFAQTRLFSAGNRDLELDKIHAGCKRIGSYLNEWLRSNNKLAEEEMKVGVFRFDLRNAA